LAANPSINIGLNSTFYINLSIINFRIWNIYKGHNDIRINKYTRIDGAQFPGLFYNYNFDSENANNGFIFNNIMTSYYYKTKYTNTADNFHKEALQWTNNPNPYLDMTTPYFCQDKTYKQSNSDTCNSTIQGSYILANQLYALIYSIPTQISLDMTVTVWINPSVIPVNSVIWELTNSTAGYNTYRGVLTSTTSVTFNTQFSNGDPSYVGSLTISPGLTTKQWLFLAFTYNPSNFKKLIIADTQFSYADFNVSNKVPYGESASLNSGYMINLSKSFTGYMRAFRMFKKSLSYQFILRYRFENTILYANINPTIDFNMILSFLLTEATGLSFSETIRGGTLTAGGYFITTAVPSSGYINRDYVDRILYNSPNKFLLCENNTMQLDPYLDVCNRSQNDSVVRLRSSTTVNLPFNESGATNDIVPEIYDNFYIRFWIRRLHGITTFTNTCYIYNDPKLKIYEAPSDLIWLRYNTIDLVKMTLPRNEIWSQITYTFVNNSLNHSQTTIQALIYYNNFKQITTTYNKVFITFNTPVSIASYIGDTSSPLYSIKDFAIGNYQVDTNMLDLITYNSISKRNYLNPLYIPFQSVSLVGTTILTKDEATGKNLSLYNAATSNYEVDNTYRDDLRFRDINFENLCGNFSYPTFTTAANVYRSTYDCVTYNGADIQGTAGGTNVNIKAPINFHQNTNEFTFETYIKLGYLPNVGSAITSTLISISSFKLNEYQSKVILQYNGSTLGISNTISGFKWVFLAFNFFQSTNGLTSQFVVDSGYQDTFPNTNALTTFASVILNISTNDVIYSYFRLWSNALSTTQLYELRYTVDITRSYNKIISYFDFRVFISSTGYYDGNTINTGKLTIDGTIIDKYTENRPICGSDQVSINEICYDKATLNFDTNNVFLEIQAGPDASTIDTVEFTIEMWYNIGIQGGTSTKILQAVGGFDVTITASAYHSVSVYYPTTMTVTGTYSVPSSQWNYFAFTYSSLMKANALFTNDYYNTKTGVSTTGAISISSFLLGYTNGSYSNNSVKMLRFYREALSVGTIIKQMYSKVDGTYFTNLTHNFYFESAYQVPNYTFAFNNLIMRNIYSSIIETDSYRIIQIDSSITPNIKLTQPNTDLVLCDAGQYRYKRLGGCSIIYSQGDVLATRFNSLTTFTVPATVNNASISLDLWFYSPQFPGTGGIVKVQDATKSLYVGAQSHSFYITWNGTGLTFNHPTSYPQAAWNYVFINVNLNNVSLIVNNNASQTQAFGPTTTNFSGTLTITLNPADQQVFTELYIKNFRMFSNQYANLTTYRYSRYNAWNTASSNYISELFLHLSFDIPSSNFIDESFVGFIVTPIIPATYSTKYAFDQSDTITKNVIARAYMNGTTFLTTPTDTISAYLTFCEGDTIINDKTGYCNVTTPPTTYYFKYNNGQVIIPRAFSNDVLMINTWFMHFWVKLFSWKSKDYIVLGNFYNATYPSFCNSGETSGMYLSYSPPSKTLNLVSFEGNTFRTILSYPFSSPNWNHFVIDYQNNNINLWINKTVVTYTGTTALPRVYKQILNSGVNDLIANFNSKCDILIGFDLGYTTLTPAQVALGIKNLGFGNMPFDGLYLPLLYRSNIDSRFIDVFYTDFSTIASGYTSETIFNPDNPIPINPSYVQALYLRSINDPDLAFETMCNVAESSLNNIDCNKFSVLSASINGITSGLMLKADSSLTDSLPSTYTPPEWTFEICFMVFKASANVIDILKSPMMNISFDRNANTLKIIFPTGDIVNKINYNMGQWFTLALSQYQVQSNLYLLSLISTDMNKTFNYEFKATLTNPILLTSSNIILGSSSIATNSSTIYYSYLRIWNVAFSLGKMYSNLSATVLDLPSNTLILNYDFRYLYDINYLYNFSQNTYSKIPMNNIGVPAGTYVAAENSQVQLCGKGYTLDITLRCNKRRYKLFDRSGRTNVNVPFPPEYSATQTLEVREYTFEFWYYADVNATLDASQYSLLVTTDGFYGNTNWLTQYNIFVVYSRSMRINCSFRDPIQGQLNIISNANYTNGAWNYWSCSLLKDKLFGLLVDGNNNYIYRETPISNGWLLNLNQTNGLSVGLDTNSAFNYISVRNLRFWKTGLSAKQVYTTMYKKLDGIYYNFLLYNLIFEEADQQAYNYVRMYDDKGNSNYYIPQLDPTMPQYDDSMMNNSNYFSICEANQNKNSKTNACKNSYVGEYILGTFLKGVQYNLTAYFYGEISVQFWMNLADIRMTQDIFSLNRGSTEYYKVTVTTTGLNIYIWSTQFNVTVSFVANKWYFIGIAISIQNLTITVQIGKQSTPIVVSTSSLTATAINNLTLVYNDLRLVFPSLTSYQIIFLTYFKIYNKIRTTETMINEANIEARLAYSTNPKVNQIANTNAIYLPLNQSGYIYDMSNYICNNTILSGAAATLINKFSGADGFYQGFLNRKDFEGNSLILCEGDFVYNSFTNMCEHAEIPTIYQWTVNSGLKIQKQYIQYHNMYDSWFVSMWMNLVININKSVYILYQESGGGINKSMFWKYTLNSSGVGQFTFRFGGIHYTDPPQYTVNYTIPSGDWVHVILINTDNTLNLYINKTLVQTICTSCQNYFSNNLDFILFTQVPFDGTINLQIKNLYMGNYNISRSIVDLLYNSNLSVNNMNLAIILDFSYFNSINKSILNLANQQIIYNFTTDSLIQKAEYLPRDYVTPILCDEFQTMFTINNTVYFCDTVNFYNLNVGNTTANTSIALLKPLNTFTLELAFIPVYSIRATDTYIFGLHYETTELDFVSIVTNTNDMFVKFNNINGNISNLTKCKIITGYKNQYTFIAIKLDYSNYAYMKMNVYVNTLDNVACSFQVPVKNITSNLKVKISDSYQLTSSFSGVYYQYIRLWKYPLSVNELSRYIFKVLYDKTEDIVLNVDFRVFVSPTSGQFFNNADNTALTNITYNPNRALYFGFPICGKNSNLDLTNVLNSNCTPKQVMSFTSASGSIILDKPLRNTKTSFFTVEFWFNYQNTVMCTTDILRESNKATPSFTFKLDVTATALTITSTAYTTQVLSTTSISSISGWHFYMFSYGFKQNINTILDFTANNSIPNNPIQFEMDLNGLELGILTSGGCNPIMFRNLRFWNKGFQYWQYWEYKYRSLINSYFYNNLLYQFLFDDNGTIYNYVQDTYTTPLVNYLPAIGAPTYTNDSGNEYLCDMFSIKYSRVGVTAVEYPAVLTNDLNNVCHCMIFI
jgi:hypothetical protein